MNEEEEAPQFVELDDTDTNSIPTFKCWMASGPDNKVPVPPLKCVGSRFLNEEKRFYMLTFEQEDGEKIDMPMYKRDYKKCSQQWGKNPAQWGACEIIRDGMRFSLVPMDGKQLHIEEPIEAE